MNIKRYRHVTLEERERLYALREQGVSLRKIAEQLNRSHTSLSREVRRNVRYGEEYFVNEYVPCKAEELARKRAKGQRKKASLKNPTIFLYVRQHLREDGWSPETIAGKLAIDQPGEHITKETIYRYIYARRLQPKTKPLLSSYLTLARRKRMKLHGRRVIRHGKIPFAVSIEKRPQAVLMRKRIGHWETDNVIARLKEYPTRTLTADNGKENSQHLKIARELQLLMFLCHTYASV